MFTHLKPKTIEQIKESLPETSANALYDMWNNNYNTSFVIESMAYEELKRRRLLKNNENNLNVAVHIKVIESTNWFIEYKKIKSIQPKCSPILNPSL